MPRNDFEEQVQPLLRTERRVERRISFLRLTEAGECPDLSLHVDESIGQVLM